MQHLTFDNTDCILYKLLKDNASYAYSIYKYKKSNSVIPSAKANSISRTFPPLFMIKIPKEEQIVEDLQEIESMQLVVQVIMVIVYIIITFIVLYYCCKKFRHMHTLFKYCFPFLLISRMLRTSHRTDLFMKGNTVWVHFMATGYFPTNILLYRPIPKESVRIETRSCIFKQMIIEWMNTEVTGISGIRIEGKISIFTDNDFEIILIACLLDQIYIVLSPQSPPRYDYAASDAMTFAQSVNSTRDLTA